MRTHGMTLQELRLFSVYLSKINPKDKSTKIVRFSLAEFQTIMELKQPNIPYFKKIAKSIVSKSVEMPTARGGFGTYNIFNVFILDPNESGEWYVEIDANDRILPLLFDIRSHFFKYELWNALRLKSKNQLRLYEILKQHEGIGYRMLSIKDLKMLLGIEETEYPKYYDFRRDVLEVCKKALSENTDISFTYEVHSKKGRGGKIHELKFIITKNKGYKDPLSLSEFIDLNADNGVIEGDYEEISFDDIDENGNLVSTGTSPAYEEHIAYLMEACNNEFPREKMMVLYDIMQQNCSHLIHQGEGRSYDYLRRKWNELNSKKAIRDRFAYMKKLVALGEGGSQ
jgi:hypothetical protein